MLKLISKLDCERCAKIKNHLETREIPFEIEMAEDKGYGYWREFAQEHTGKLGFPILIYVSPFEQGFKAINGSYDEITEKIMEWYPPEIKEILEQGLQGVIDEVVSHTCDHPKYDWCFCTKCNHNVV